MEWKLPAAADPDEEERPNNGMIISEDYDDAKMKERKFQAWNEVWYVV